MHQGSGSTENVADLRKLSLEKDCNLTCVLSRFSFQMRINMLLQFEQCATCR